jgi:hypothetical protein
MRKKNARMNKDDVSKEDVEDEAMGRGSRLKAAFPDAIIEQDGPLLVFDVNTIFEQIKEEKPKSSRSTRV